MLTGAVTVAVVFGWWASSLRSNPDSASSPTRPTEACEVPAPTAPGIATVQILAVDDGTRCWPDVRYDRSTATLDLGERGRYLLGRPGDVLVVGDWDCDGSPTPALYRPADGRTFRFAAWADEASVSSATAEQAVAHGTPRVVRRDGCDHLVVEAPA